MRLISEEKIPDSDFTSEDRWNYKIRKHQLISNGVVCLVTWWRRDDINGLYRDKAGGSECILFPFEEGFGGREIVNYDEFWFGGEEGKTIKKYRKYIAGDYEFLKDSAYKADWVTNPEEVLG